MKIGRTFLDGIEQWISVEKDGAYILNAEKQYPWEFTDEQLGERVKPTASYLPPLTHICSIRDFFSFEGHVRGARARRGLEVPKEWYKFPVFYFTNPNAVQGSGSEVTKPKHTSQMDFEAEFMIVIGKKGIDITKHEAMDYVAGISLANDWSARDIQMEEIKVGLGPAKGKDFALSLGPLLVTGEDLHSLCHSDQIDLDLTVSVNGKKVSSGNLNQAYWSYPDMIARASQDCFLYPGDIIMSGTIEKGCILEIGSDVVPWLERGDTVTLHSNSIGDLFNIIG